MNDNSEKTLYYLLKQVKDKGSLNYPFSPSNKDFHTYRNDPDFIKSHDIIKEEQLIQYHDGTKLGSDKDVNYSDSPYLANCVELTDSGESKLEYLSEKFDR